MPKAALFHRAFPGLPVGVLTHWATSPVNALRKPHPTADDIWCKQPGPFGGGSPEMSFLLRRLSRVTNFPTRSERKHSCWQPESGAFTLPVQKDTADFPAARQQALYLQAQLSH